MIIASRYKMKIFLKLLIIVYIRKKSDMYLKNANEQKPLYATVIKFGLYAWDT